jgi:hypothetical protein
MRQMQEQLAKALGETLRELERQANLRMPSRGSVLAVLSSRSAGLPCPDRHLRPALPAFPAKQTDPGSVRRFRRPAICRGRGRENKLFFEERKSG